jgi:signal transduction histidine kinase
VQRLGLTPTTVDRALAAILTVALELETWLGGNANGHRIAVAVAGPVVTVAVAFRRRYPTAVGIVAALDAVVMQAVWPSQVLSYAVAWICDLYGLAVWSRTRSFAIGLAVYLVASVASLPFVPDAAGSVFFIVVSTVVMLLVRSIVGERDRRARMAERERDLVAREAVVEERARIARELHDVIAHNVSMIVVQAGAERRVVEPGSTHEVLETIEQIGRGALTEMRRLLGMLRSDDRDPLAPQPGLADLPALVSQVTEAGLPVELRTHGEPRSLPAGLDLSAYRIIQEALTNALKHAGDARANVEVRYGPDSIELEIVDDGVGATTRASGGHGLVGMRERVALYGGRLDAGRRPNGGFAVNVLLPIR